MPNTLADIPSDRFAIHARSLCGHWARVDTIALPADLQIDTLHGRLRCQVCGSREVSIRILWTATGGLKHSGGVAA